jgi:RNA polymerase sigma factor (sigma-70 family)
MSSQLKMEEMEIKEELLRALDCLNFDQKEVLTLKFFGELGNDQISKIIGKSEEAIRQIQSRSIKKLQSILINL